MKIELKNTSGEIIFTYHKEGNTVKATVVEAIRQGVSLQYVDLSGVDLRDADLSGADLSRTNLRRTNLRFADLSNANLSHANLSHADLIGADLSGVDLNDADLIGADLRQADLTWVILKGADLSRADLRGVDLSGVDLNNTVLPIYSKWEITINTDGMIRIGCKCKSITDWDIWFAGDEVYETARNTDEFRLIYANYISVREYYLLTKS